MSSRKSRHRAVAAEPVHPAPLSCDVRCGRKVHRLTTRPLPSRCACPRDKAIVAHCKTSMRGYEAVRILKGAGFEQVRFMDGGLAAWPFDVAKG